MKQNVILVAGIAVFSLFLLSFPFVQAQEWNKIENSFKIFSQQWMQQLFDLEQKMGRTYNVGKLKTIIEQNIQVVAKPIAQLSRRPILEKLLILAS